MKSKFQKYTGRYTCFVCSKETRDTGRGEAEVEMCAKCLYESYVENAASDYGINSAEHKAALRMLESLNKK